MRVIPGTQNKRLLDPSEMMDVDTEEYVLDLAIHPDEIDESMSTAPLSTKVISPKVSFPASA